MANTPAETDAQQTLDEITEEQVTEYLKNNPDLFMRRDDLLCEMTLSHDTGGAVSFLERQSSLLRDRHKKLRQQLDELLAAARDNEQLFAKSKQLILSLLDAQSLDAIVNSCLHSLRDHFTIEFASLIIFGEPQSYLYGTSRIVPIDEAYQNIPGLLKTETISCGVLRPKELKFLFAEAAQTIGSAAVVPLNRVPPIGVLAIGSSDPHYFGSTMSTLFLEYIGEVLKRLLPRYLS